jgi:hypothetical protein
MRNPLRHRARTHYPVLRAATVAVPKSWRCDLMYSAGYNIGGKHGLDVSCEAQGGADITMGVYVAFCDGRSAASPARRREYARIVRKVQRLGFGPVKHDCCVEPLGKTLAKVSEIETETIRLDAMLRAAGGKRSK